MPNIPRRITAHLAHMRVGLANIALSGTAWLYTPPANNAAWDALPIFGPVRDLEIEDPTDRVVQTAGGDVGGHETLTRKGIWMIRGGAFLDLSAVNGDVRLATLNGQYVDVALYNESGFGICRGLGKMEIRLILPAASGETVARDFTISRYVGTSLGGLTWADLDDGAYA